MNVGTLSISLVARTAGLAAASARVKTFEKGVLASAQRVNRGLSMVGMSFSALTIPLVAVGVTASKMFSDFEFSLAKVEGLVGIARRTVEKWGDSILSLSTDVAKTPRELAEALYYVTSAGIRGVETMQVLEYSAKAAAAGLGETKVVADGVTSAMNAYGKANLSAKYATDVLVMSIREGKVEPSQFAASIGKALPVAAQLGVSFNEVGAAMAAMTRTGTPATTSAIYLRRMLSSLIKPTGQAREALMDMGTSFYQFRETLEGKGGLLQVLMQVREMVDRFGEEQVGKIFPNLRAMIPVLDIIGKNLENNKKLWENILHPVGAADRAFKAAARTFKFQWKQAVAGLETSFIKLGESIGKTLIPLFKNLSNYLQGFAQKWTNLSKGTQQMIIKIGLLTAVIGPLITVLQLLIQPLLRVVSVMFSFVAAIGTTGLAIIGIAAAIYLLINAGVALYQSWDKTWASIQIGWNNIQLAALKVVDWFQTFDWGKMFKNLKERFANFFKNIINWFKKFFKDLNELIERGIKRISNSDIIANFGQYEPISMSFRNEYVKEDIAGLEAANEKLKKSMEGKLGFGEAFKNNWNTQFDFIKDAISRTANKLIPSLSEITNLFKNTGFGVKREKEPSLDFEEWMLSSKTWDIGKNLPKEDSFTDLSGVFDLMNSQLERMNTRYAYYGEVVNIAEERTRILEQAMEAIRERGGPFSPEDFALIQKISKELQPLSQGFLLLQEQVGNFGSVFGNLSSILTDLGANADNVLMRFVSAFEKIFNVLSNVISIMETFNNIQQVSKRLTELATAAKLKDALALGMQGKASATSAALTAKANSTVAASKLAESATNASAAVSGVIASGARLPYPFNLAAITSGVAAVMAGLAQTPAAVALTGLKDGGIIPDGYNGDKFPAALNSREAVIPLERLPQLLNINQNDKSKEVVFVIDGHQLVGIMDKENIRRSAF